MCGDGGVFFIPEYPCDGCNESLKGVKCKDSSQCEDWKKWMASQQEESKKEKKMSGHLFEMHAHSV
ncbi:MAG: hypothetical protein Q8L10_03055 [Candidatus Moranbacteria bacterium]|nr:hypothetical protein [Candidatus Moranbacteria bacterium]